MKKETRISFGRKFAFAIGDVFGGGAFNVINFFYPSFLALTVGLSAYWISVIMLVVRVWDAVTDPIMGYISDATQSKMGKRRIYILVAAPVMYISFFLLFYPYSFSEMGLRAFAVFASYALYSTVDTVIMIPYHSLASEISTSYKERASINALRLGCSIFSSILCVVAPGMIIDSFENPGDGYIAMGLIFGGVFMLVVLITALFTREQIHTPPLREKFSVQTFLKPLKLQAFRQYLLMQLCLSMGMAIMSSLFFFYIDFYIMRDVTLLGESNMLGLLSAALMFAMQIVGLPFYLWLMGKKSKAFAYRAGAMLWVLGGLLILLAQPGIPALYIYLLAALIGFGISGPGVAPHAMFGDVMDMAQITFGTRSEGAFSGLVNLINKIAQAGGLALAMAILGVAGFTEQALGAAKVISQPESAQNALRWMMALTPLVFMSIGALVSLRYPIDGAMQRALSEKIAALEK